MIYVQFLVVLWIVVFGFGTLCACQPIPPPTPPEPNEDVDAGVDDAGAFVCEGAPCACMCANLDRLNCTGVDGRRLADPTPGGTTCIASCEHYEANPNLGMSLNPTCQMKASTCTKAQDCPK